MEPKIYNEYELRMKIKEELARQHKKRMKEIVDEQIKHLFETGDTGIKVIYPKEEKNHG